MSAASAAAPTSPPSSGWRAPWQRRGPDGAGAWASEGIALAHRRLSIIDLSPAGAQPFTDPLLGLTVAFNGCIYNYPDLLEELEAEGYTFAGHSDTEVILKAWHRWGEDALDRLHGMFAFAIAERDSGRLILVRDRLGIKPLYLAERRRRACASPRRCPRCWPAAGSTPRSTASRCTTTSPGTRSSRRRGRSSPACASCRPRPS